MGENINFKDYVKCDEKLLVSEKRTAEEIFEDINDEEVNNDDEKDESSVATEVNISEESPALNILNNYIG